MENKTTNNAQTGPLLRATTHCINLQVPEQVHLLCKLLDVELSGVLQRFINDLGHDLYGTNGSSERWQAIEYFMECGYGLHNYGEHDIHQMFYELEQLRNRWAGGDQAAEEQYAAWRVRYLVQWYRAWLEKRRPGTMTQALELL